MKIDHWQASLGFPVRKCRHIGRFLRNIKKKTNHCCCTIGRACHLLDGRRAHLKISYCSIAFVSSLALVRSFRCLTIDQTWMFPHWTYTGKSNHQCDTVGRSSEWERTGPWELFPAEWDNLFIKFCSAPTPSVMWPHFKRSWTRAWALLRHWIFMDLSWSWNSYLPELWEIKF